MLGAQISVLIGLLAVSQSQNIETRSVAAYPKQQSGGLGPLFASFGGGGGFRDNSYEDNAVTPTPVYRGQQQQPQQQPIRIGSPQQQQQKQRVLLVRGQQHHHLTKNGQPIKYKPGEESLEEQLEREEPDRLSLLLPQSRFDCVGKQTGYYADEELNCEVFHYCQDNARHSWICPEGFTFHQVHLICMPPNSPAEITCKKSSQYHFVNEYLYKPLNLQEAESRPNVTLRYSERYFPADIYTDERADRSDEYSASSSVRVHQQPRRPPIYLAQQTVPTLNSIPGVGGFKPTPSSAPQQQQHQQQQFRAIPINQVFRRPEEVNIPLEQRRPQGTTPSSQSQNSNSPLRRFPSPVVRPSVTEDDEYE